MADDAGALLVRSGLVSSSALDDARARVASIGGTLGEQLVTTGAITDDELTSFYRSRLLVPQVNPNTLARLTPKVVAAIPSDMAIELRAIPVSLDADNNLTVAMSDPSDRHAVDEIAFFTGAYVVRAVATQMQIAWCLAHYYGHVTALGQRLLRATEGEAAAASSSPPAQAARPPRAKGLTGKVNASRHRAIAPVTGPVDVLRPASHPIDLRRFDPAGAGAAASQGVPATSAAGASAATGNGAARSRAPGAGPATVAAVRAPGAATVAAAAPAPKAAAAAAAPKAAAPPALPPGATLPTSLPRLGPNAPTLVPGERSPVSAEIPTPAFDDDGHDHDDDDDEDHDDDHHDDDGASASDLRLTADGSVDKPRSRSVSGEIRVPVKRAPSIRPPMPQPEEDEGPLIMIEMRDDEDLTGMRALPLRRRPIVKTNPPELYARAGEVALKAGSDRAIDADEPRIVIDEDALAPNTGRIAARRAPPDDAAPPIPMDEADDADTAAVIYDRAAAHDDRPVPPARSGDEDDDSDTGEIAIVVLDAPKKPRRERRTRIGIPPAPVNTRPARDGDSSGVPAALARRDADRSLEPVGDATAVDLQPAPRGEDAASDPVAAPPSVHDADTNPYLVAPPEVARQSAPAPNNVRATPDEARRRPPVGPTAAAGTGGQAEELDEIEEIAPERTGEIPDSQLRRRPDYDPVDDGWGPPGTTIPPPLIGAVPGGDDDDASSGAIPMPNVDSSPLLVGPPAPPSAAAPGGRALTRALEDATARALEVIRQLEHTRNRDQIVEVMVSYLAECHHRAGFFVFRHPASKDAGELALFAMRPRPTAMPAATLRLDRASTLQDVVGTRLPYRGPMHDDASRAFLISTLGACPPEILLVPVAVRERVVGVLFGEHRQRHTFDDQLALAARAAGMAFERILRSRRG